jgi:hypothetical protein
MNNIKISKPWWEHLVPKTMISRRREVESLLNRFVKSSPYGFEWAKVAANPSGLFRLKVGNIMPVVHLTFIVGYPGFAAPLQTFRLGHRTVSRESEYLSGKALVENEHVLQPIIVIELVTDPVYVAAAAIGKLNIEEDKVVWPSQIISIPAHLLLAPQHSPEIAYVIYQHIFGNGSSYPNDGFFYVGVTKRSWQKRWSEHKRAIDNGSPLLFHSKYRDEKKNGRVTYINHKVMGVTNNLELLYSTEDFLVESHWEDERRLNMIPGGKSGLRYLRENGLLKKSVVPLPDERYKIVDRWLRQNPRKGLPAPWVAEKWKDNDWAVAQICGRDGRLSVEQVRAIRELAKKYTAEKIYESIGAKDVAQVTRVLNGQTYARID